MIAVVHPFGNQNVRQVLESLVEAGEEPIYFTGLGFSREHWLTSRMPGSIGAELRRRAYNIESAKIRSSPARDGLRLLVERSGWKHRLPKGVSQALSPDAVFAEIDAFAARKLQGEKSKKIKAVYAYEDGAHQTFLFARDRGISCIYDLPIAYWETSQRLIREEAERLPAWAGTLVGRNDPLEKLERKTRELHLADTILCPSRFVMESLPEATLSAKNVFLAPFGCPQILGQPQKRPSDRVFRILFAGSLTQRKGLADLFAAMKLLRSKSIELVVLGSLISPLEFYRREWPNFTYETPRPHAGVLRLMQQCDAFVLPSYVEGRALVVLEALACGLPVITTRNSGTDDVVIDGKTGFLVPIRSPEALALRIEELAGNPKQGRAMGEAARTMAQRTTWKSYRNSVLQAVLGPN